MQITATIDQGRIGHSDRRPALFVRPAKIDFSVSIKTPQGERGCVVRAADSYEAARHGIARLNIRDEEIPANGLDVRVRVSS